MKLCVRVHEKPRGTGNDFEDPDGWHGANLSSTRYCLTQTVTGRWLGLPSSTLAAPIPLPEDGLHCLFRFFHGESSLPPPQPELRVCWVRGLAGQRAGGRVPLVALGGGPGAKRARPSLCVPACAGQQPGGGAGALCARPSRNETQMRQVFVERP